VDHGHRNAGRDGGEQPQPGRAGNDRAPRTGEGAHQHHALDAHIEHAGALGNRFAERREQHRRRQAEGGGE